MAREWVQQYEDNGRLINKYVDTDTGAESFEDAGAVGSSSSNNPIYGAAPTAQDIMAQVQYGSPIYGQSGVSGFVGLSPSSGGPLGTLPPPTPAARGPQIGSGGQVQVPGSGNDGDSGGNASDFWVEDERERRHWVNGQVVERIPKGGAGGPAAASAGGNSGYEELLKSAAATAARAEAMTAAYNAAMLKYKSDELAQAAAAQAWKQKFEEQKRDFDQQMATKGFGLSEAAVTGMYNGAPTLARQTAENSTAMGLLGMNANLTGPSNYLTYLRTLSNTPSGLTDLVNGLSGKFQLSRQQGSAPGAGYERLGVDTLVRDLNDARAQPPAADLSGIALPGGSQWNPNAVNILSRNPTQWGLTQNLYQESGRSWDTELANYLSSLPKFGGARQAAVRL